LDQEIISMLLFEGEGELNPSHVSIRGFNLFN
jgi:hypothetical protein